MNYLEEWDFLPEILGLNLSSKGDLALDIHSQNKTSYAKKNHSNKIVYRKNDTHKLFVYIGFQVSNSRSIVFNHY